MNDGTILLAIFVAFVVGWVIGKSSGSNPPAQKPPAPKTRPATSRSSGTQYPKHTPKHVGPPRQKPSKPNVAVPPTEIGSYTHGRAYVIDGDSIVINGIEIRLFGIDAPEMNHPYGRNAKWALVNMCKGRKIDARLMEKDHFNRTVARCFLPDGRDLSAEMVKCGMAIDWPKFSGGQYTQLEVAGIRKKLWLADARQKGRMHVWEKYEAIRRNQQNPPA